jgi:hypothetical protein
VLCVARETAAQARVFDVSATSVWPVAVAIGAGSTIVIETTNLSAGSDTVMHLWLPSADVEVAWNDDVDATGRSRIEWTNSAWGTDIFYVIVRGASSSTGGTADLRINGATFVSPLPFGGELIDVVDGTPYVHETVRRPGGETDSWIFGLNAAGRLTGLNDNGGLGNMSRMTATSATTHVVVGTPFEATQLPGGVRLISNNPGLDPDGDGLDPDVEVSWQINTCSGVGTCSSSMHYTEADTDRDGILDGAEVLGIASADGDLHLAAWGADPRRKDLFVEIDFVDGAGPVSGTNPFADGAMGAVAREAFATTLAQIFGDQAGVDIRNPNGVPGIALHLDLGVSATSPGLATTYGAWGGGGDAVDRGAFTSEFWYLEARLAHMDPMRRSVFRYAVADIPGGGGQAAEGALSWGIGSVAPFAVQALAHELGHTAGLAHWGHDDAPSDALNGSPTYDSIMNYCHIGAVGFSDGDWSAYLNPSAVDESNAVQNDIGVGRMQGGLWNFLTSASDLSWVDFTRDGSAGDGIRGAPAWCQSTADQAMSNENVDQTLFSNVTGGSTPDILRGPGDRLYVFYVNGSSLVYRRSQPYSSTLDGSCPNGDGLRVTTTAGVGCMNWFSNSMVVSPPTGVTVQSVSAVQFGGVTIAIRGSDNRLYTGQYTSATGNGILTGWSGWTALDTGIQGEVELAVMPVNPDHFSGASYALGVFFRGSDARHYWRWTTSNPPAWVGTVSVFRVGLGSLVGSHGPDVSAWPTVQFLSEFEDTATPCGAFPDGQGLVRILCLDRSSPTNQWLDLTEAAFNVAGSCTVCAPQPSTLDKPALRFHILRNNAGAPYYSTFRGLFWLVTTQSANGLDVPIVLLSEALNQNLLPASALRFRRAGNFGNQWTNVNHGVSLFEDLSVGALKAAYFNATRSQLLFVPFADGGFDVQLGDVSDWQVMERGLCDMQGERDPLLCGSVGHWGY